MNELVTICLLVCHIFGENKENLVFTRFSVELYAKYMEELFTSYIVGLEKCDDIIRKIIF